MKSKLTFVLLFVVLSAIFTISLTTIQAGYKAWNGYGGETQGCCNVNNRYSYTHRGLTPKVYELTVHTRAWYEPGITGVNPCKANNKRRTYNTNDTGHIITTWFSGSATYHVTKHSYVYDDNYTSYGNFYTSTYDDNKWADINYFKTRNGTYPGGCGTPVTWQ